MSNSALNKIGELAPKSITAGQAKDTGMAMVLICLLVAVLGRQPRFVWIAMGLVGARYDLASCL